MAPTRHMKGRGAGSNPEGRFAERTAELEDEVTAVAPSPETRLHPENARSLITRNASPDVPFDRSINPYRGCEHGCIYCYARPSHAYMDLSPGLDFETRIFFKAGAADILRQELARPAYRPESICIGANTDPYQPAERRLRVTREILEVLAETRHPVSLITKGGLVLRDLDLLSQMAADGIASVAVSVTCLDEDIKRSLEPRAASAKQRLRVIRELTDAGVPVTALVAPVIPRVTDHELEAILEAVAGAGAVSAAYILLRLPYEVKGLFREWLDAHVPMRAEHVMSLVRQMRGGRENDPRFGHRMRGEGEFARLIHARFTKTARRLGLDRERPALRTDLFVPPSPSGQASLF